jgi:hypothetical protein
VTDRPKCSHSGKEIFYGAVTAQWAAEKYLRKRNVKLRVYQCPHCHNYHLTKINALTVAEMFKDIPK